MLDYLWAAMMILGVVWGLLQGRAAELTQAVIDSGKDAVSLAITMLGVTSVWTGLMEVGKNAGLLRQLNRLLKPVISLLFPRLPENHPAAEAISANFAANLLGLGNAATPAAIKAMKELKSLQEDCPDGERAQAERKSDGQNAAKRASDGQNAARRDFGAASNEMCTFLIINISSLQLLPINMIAYRSQYGSLNPAAIVGPAIAATAASTIAAVIFCRLMDRKNFRY